MQLAIHTDSGRVEAIITAARKRLEMGMSNEDVIADLVSKGVDAGQAQLAIVAAEILIKDRHEVPDL